MAFERDPKKLFPHDHIMKYTFVPLVPHFVTPNGITIFRMLATPVVLLILLSGNYSLGVPSFLFLAFTDALDGSVARLRGQITKWGTFYDPVADKLLITSVVLLIVIQHVNPIFAFLIIGLEVLIVFGGFIRKRNGKVTTANVFGKTKMFLQVAGVTMLLIAVWLGYDLFIPVSEGTLALAIIFAIISLFTYGL